jgi:hypothetical protein
MAPAAPPAPPPRNRVLIAATVAIFVTGYLVGGGGRGAEQPCAPLVPLSSASDPTLGRHAQSTAEQPASTHPATRGAARPELSARTAVRAPVPTPVKIGGELYRRRPSPSPLSEAEAEAAEREPEEEAPAEEVEGEEASAEKKTEASAEERTATPPPRTRPRPSRKPAPAAPAATVDEEGEESEADEEAGSAWAGLDGGLLCGVPYRLAQPAATLHPLTDPSSPSSEAVFVLALDVGPKHKHAVADARACASGRDVFVVVPERARAERAGLTFQPLLLPGRGAASPGGLPGDEAHGLSYACSPGENGGPSFPVITADASHMEQQKWFGFNMDNSMRDGTPMPKVTSPDTGAWFLFHAQDVYASAWHVEEDVSWPSHGAVCGWLDKYGAGGPGTGAGTGDIVSFRVAEHKSDFPEWVWWRFCDAVTANPAADCVGTFNALYRYSSRLMNVVGAYRAGHPRFVFSEVLLPTLARMNGLSIVFFAADEVPTLRCCDPVSDHEARSPPKPVVPLHPWKRDTHACQM